MRKKQKDKKERMVHFCPHLIFQSEKMTWAFWNFWNSARTYVEYSTTGSFHTLEKSKEVFLPVLASYPGGPSYLSLVWSGPISRTRWNWNQISGSFVKPDWNHPSVMEFQVSGTGLGVWFQTRLRIRIGPKVLVQTCLRIGIGSHF